jgi:hypothetical protein
VLCQKALVGYVFARSRDLRSDERRWPLAAVCLEIQGDQEYWS